MTDPTTVFVIDDDAAVRRGLSKVLRASGFQVEVFASGAAFAGRAPFDGVGCVVLDLRMPEVSGAEVQRQLASNPAGLPVIFVSGHAELSDGVRAMKQGAVDFLTKPVDEDVLLEAVNAALARHTAVRAAHLDREASLRRLETLTAREQEVLRYVISGALNKQIADAMGIAEGTVKVHRGRVVEKMGAQSVADLVRICAIIGIEPKSCG